MTKPIRKIMMALAVVLAFGLMTPMAEARTPCKELNSKRACEAREDCVFVDSYTRKDGAKINAYCRSKGKAGTKSKDKKSSKSETDKKVKDKDKKAKKEKKTSSKDKSSNEKGKSEKKVKSKKDKVEKKVKKSSNNKKDKK